VVPVTEWRAPVDFLAFLSADGREDILTGARPVPLRAGDVADFPRDRSDADLVASGVVRAYQVAEDGREATIGYLYGGEWLGALPVLGTAPVVHLQAVVDSVILRLDPARFRTRNEGDIAVSHALAVHTATILARVVRVVTVRTLGSVLDRVAFDLLERASVDQLRSGELVFKVTHEELASSVGSVREVVTRALRELREAGIVSTSHGRVRVDDPARLTRVVNGLVV